MRISIRAKLLVLVLTILIPFIVLQYNSITQGFKNRIDSELKACQDLSMAISTGFVNYVEEVWIQEAVIATYFLQHPNLSAEKLQAYIKEVQDNQEILTRISWTNPEGIVIASSAVPMIGKSVKERDYYKRIIKGEDKVISDLELSLFNGEPVVMIVIAVRKDGKLKGIVNAVIDVERLSHKLPTSKMTLASRFGLIDTKGMVVYKSDAKAILYEKRKISDESPAWKALKGEIVKTPKGYSSFDKTLSMGVDYPIKEFGWDCFVTTSYNSVIAQHTKRLINDVIVLAIVSVLSILLAYILGKRFLKQLGNLNKAVNTIKAGDFSARANIHGRDELAVTAEAFDSMAESIEQNDIMKSQFFTNLSHDLKMPLNVILASSQLIEKTESLSASCPNHEKIHTQMKVIKQNCYRLIRMVSNLMDVSKYESGFLKIRLGNHNIVSIVEDITMSIVKYAKTKGIDVLFDTDAEEKIMACDPDMIERIILNIISNSLKFTDENGSIFVNFCDKGDSVLIVIRDTGIGIPQDKLQTVFERFKQVDTSQYRNHEGSGIGLSLVKALVEAHKGIVSAASELGKGTEIRMEIPVTVLSEAELQNSEIKPAPSQSLVQRINVEFSDIYQFRDLV